VAALAAAQPQETMRQDAALQEGFELVLDEPPLYVAQTSLARGELVPLLERHALPVQPIHAVFPSPRQVPAKVVSFVNWLQGQFDDGWWARAG
jgi:DNA-binding transcriptional LysR family regulator